MLLPASAKLAVRCYTGPHLPSLRLLLLLNLHIVPLISAVLAILQNCIALIIINIVIILLLLLAMAAAIAVLLLLLLFLVLRADCLAIAVLLLLLLLAPRAAPAAGISGFTQARLTSLNLNLALVKTLHSIHVTRIMHGIQTLRVTKIKLLLFLGGPIPIPAITPVIMLISNKVMLMLIVSPFSLPLCVSVLLPLLHTSLGISSGTAGVATTAVSTTWQSIIQPAIIFILVTKRPSTTRTPMPGQSSTLVPTFLGCCRCSSSSACRVSIINVNITSL